MASSKIFFDNHITSASQLTSIVVTGGAVGQSVAQVSGPQAVKSGTGTMTVGGTYSALISKTYYIEAHVATTGSFATTRLRWSDTVFGTWNVENITPSNGVPISLSSGVTVTFVNGPNSPNFVLGDLQIFRVEHRWGPAKALDGSRDSEWRSGTMPTSSTLEWRIDVGSSLAPGVVALLDTNIPSNATTQLFSTASNFTTINSTTIVPWNAGRMIALVTAGASRYWVLRVTLTSTALTYLRWSEIFLGTVETFDRTFDIGYDDDQRALGVVDVEGHLMRGPAPLVLRGRYLTLTYSHILSATDVDRLTRLDAWSHDATYRVQRPFFFIPIDSMLTDFSLFQWANSYRKQHGYLDRYNVVPELAEVVRSIA